jgi:hypothetical protein
MHIANAPHILTMDCLLDRQPAVMRMFPKSTVQTRTSPVDWEAPVQRWKDNLIEVEVVIDGQPIWGVWDTGYSEHILLVNGTAEPSDTVIHVTDIYGHTQAHYVRERTVALHSLHLPMAVASSSHKCQQRKAYIGLKAMQYFDFAIQENRLLLHRNNRPL